MTHPLLDTLEQKVRTMVTEQATLQLEISQLTLEIQRLQEEQKVWQKQLDTQLNSSFDNKLQHYAAVVPSVDQ